MLGSLSRFGRVHHIIGRPASCGLLASGLLAALGCSEDSGPDSPVGAVASLAPRGDAAGGRSAGGADGTVAGGADGTVAGGADGTVAGGGVAGGAGGSGGTGSVVLGIPWNWTGIVGTGQSLAVGEPDGLRNMPAAAARATTQPFNNLKLSTGSAPWPVDSNDPSLALVPLIEPIGRPSTAYPSSWPTNIAGETPHAAMANQITALVQAAGGADYVSVHSEVGENGQALSFLIKGAAQVGVNGHAYEATLIETRAITRLAQAADKTYGVGAITVTHGESDAGNTNYAAELHQLWVDYAADLAAITGQTEPPLMIVSQQHASGSDRAPSTLAQWRIGLDYAGDVVCSGPKYQYAYTPDSVHMTVEAYEQLGEKYAQVYFERVVLGRDWQPLQPTKVERAGRVVTVTFHVPVTPLAWETTFQAPHAGTPAWSAGKGFELRSGASPLGIASVEIVGDAVQITADADLPASGVTVGYALSADPPATAGAMPPAMTQPFVATFRWGLLRDSDPFVGYTTQKLQPNFAVAFEMDVP
jgi:hypothetical protein